MSRPTGTLVYPAGTSPTIGVACGADEAGRPYAIEAVEQLDDGAHVTLRLAGVEDLIRWRDARAAGENWRSFVSSGEAGA